MTLKRYHIVSAGDINSYAQEIYHGYKYTMLDVQKLSEIINGIYCDKRNGVTSYLFLEDEDGNSYTIREHSGEDIYDSIVIVQTDGSYLIDDEGVKMRDISHCKGGHGEGFDEQEECKISFTFGKEDREELKKYVKKCGYRSVSDFCRLAIYNELKGNYDGRFNINDFKE